MGLFHRLLGALLLGKAASVSSEVRDTRRKRTFLASSPRYVYVLDTMTVFIDLTLLHACDSRPFTVVHTHGLAI